MVFTILGRRDPRGSVYTDEGYISRLPSPRVLSSNMMLGSNVSDSLHSHALMQFGQFLDHDLSANSKGGMYVKFLDFVKLPFVIYLFRTPKILDFKKIYIVGEIYTCILKYFLEKG